MSVRWVRFIFLVGIFLMLLFGLTEYVSYHATSVFLEYFPSPQQNYIASQEENTENLEYHAANVTAYEISDEPTPETPQPQPIVYVPSPAAIYVADDFPPPDYISEELVMRIEFPEPARLIALTFDDGPSQYTEYILDALEKHGARATFCVLGYRVDAWAGTILRAVDLGNEIIGHSWNHRSLIGLNTETVTWQIEAPSAAIKTVTGESPPRLFRAPYGQANNQVQAIAEVLGYSMLRWSMDPMDWRYRDAQHIYQHIMARATHGSIIVMHDIYPSTSEAMTQVIPSLIERGFTLVTASELIEALYGGLEPGKIFTGLR